MQDDTRAVLLFYVNSIFYATLLIFAIAFDGPVWFRATFLLCFCVTFGGFWFYGIKWHNRRTYPLKGFRKSEQSPEK